MTNNKTKVENLKQWILQEYGDSTNILFKFLYRLENMSDAKLDDILEGKWNKTTITTK